MGGLLCFRAFNVLWLTWHWMFRGSSWCCCCKLKIGRICCIQYLTLPYFLPLTHPLVNIWPRKSPKLNCYPIQFQILNQALVDMKQENADLKERLARYEAVWLRGRSFRVWTGHRNCSHTWLATLKTRVHHTPDPPTCSSTFNAGCDGKAWGKQTTVVGPSDHL